MEDGGSGSRETLATIDSDVAAAGRATAPAISQLATGTAWRRVTPPPAYRARGASHCVPAIAKNVKRSGEAAIDAGQNHWLPRHGIRRECAKHLP